MKITTLYQEPHKAIENWEKNPFLQSYFKKANDMNKFANIYEGEALVGFTTYIEFPTFHK